MTPRALNGVCEDACTLVNEATPVVNGTVRVTFRVEIPVRTRAITDDRNGGFDPCICNGLQIFGGPVLSGNEKRFTCLAVNTAQHPLPNNSESIGLELLDQRPFTKKWPKKIYTTFYSVMRHFF
jgi:hypothetical protein